MAAKHLGVEEAQTALCKFQIGITVPNRMLSGILCNLRMWDCCRTSDWLTRRWRLLRLRGCLSGPVEEVNRLIDDNQKGPTEILNSCPQNHLGVRVRAHHTNEAAL
jgi:hypothetical protein